jgi:diguanylate cyclase (GGDEF)-like protein
MTGAMSHVTRFAIVLAAFVMAVAGVVWTTTAEERRIAARESAERQVAQSLHDGIVARDSAVRGFAESKRDSFLESYDEATAILADSLDRGRRTWRGNENALAWIDEQERIAERWQAIANDTIIRVRNGRQVTVESSLIRADLLERFEAANDELVEEIAADAEEAHRRALQRAVILIVLLSGGFAAGGGLLLQRLRRREEAQRLAEESYHATQREFAETLQVTESEAEAHELVKRHLERSLDASRIVVLNRNNSQNRLEAATAVDPDDPLAHKLVDSSPRSCLAIRLGRAHAQEAEREPLLSCELCGEQTRTTCVPSLVGGEVIGSVLVEHERPLTTSERSRIDESVSQAAPVLANLRNLAIAEVRAATDALTGLPNARAVRDSLVRMVAQSSRSQLPLAAVLCDLDNFKQINDVYGHDKGDQALAAASAALRSSLRESDLVGRYGGEEFLILLPDTPLDGALVLAEKLRSELALVNVPGVDRAITASFGVACFPDDAPDGEMLVRMADRALYAAKAGGRNCVVASGTLLAGSES